MRFTDSIKTCFRKYVDFTGRAQRSEYWWFLLFTFAGSIVLGIIASFAPVLQFLEWVFSLAVLLPSLAVTARRLHDTNRTGWWILLPIGLGLAGIVAGAVVGVFVSDDDGWRIIASVFLSVAGGLLGLVVGYLVLLNFLIQPSDPGPNRYGPSPMQHQPGMGGYGYQGPGHPYPPPTYGGYDEPPFAQGTAEIPPAAEVGPRQFCTQCGMQLREGSQFCSVCGTPVA